MVRFSKIDAKKVQFAVVGSSGGLKIFEVTPSKIINLLKTHLGKKMSFSSLATIIPLKSILLASANSNALVIYSTKSKQVLFKIENPYEGPELCNYVSIKPLDVSDYSHAQTGCNQFIVKTRQSIYLVDTQKRAFEHKIMSSGIDELTSPHADTLQVRYTPIP